MCVKAHKWRSGDNFVELLPPSIIIGLLGLSVGQAGSQALYPVLASSQAFVDMLGRSRLDILLSLVSYSCQQFRILPSTVIKKSQRFLEFQ